MKRHPHKCHRRESYGAGWRTVGDLGGEGCGKARRSREREDVEHRIGAKVLQWMPCLESERAEEGEGRRFWSLALLCSDRNVNGSWFLYSQLNLILAHRSQILDRMEQTGQGRRFCQKE